MDFFNKRRILSTRIFTVGFILLITFTADSWDPKDPVDLFIEWTGFIFLIIATLGRLWCSIYIGGYKNNRVINEGPYSIVRNPLYIFSFLGGIGLGLAAENLLVLSLVILLFIIYYPSVVYREEKDLEALRKFVENDSDVRSYHRLHAKFYIFV